MVAFRAMNRPPGWNPTVALPVAPGPDLFGFTDATSNRDASMSWATELHADSQVATNRAAQTVYGRVTMDYSTLGSVEASPASRNAAGTSLGQLGLRNSLSAVQLSFC